MSTEAVFAHICWQMQRFSSLSAHSNLIQVLPLAFVAKSDEEKDVAEVWRDVWEDATSGTPAALRLYIADIVPLITAGDRADCLQLQHVRYLSGTETSCV